MRTASARRPGSSAKAVGCDGIAPIPARGVRRSSAGRIALLGFLVAARLLATQRPWTPFGPDGGGPTVLAVDPAHEQTLFAAIPWGLFSEYTLVARSVDGGTTWQPRNAGLEADLVISLAVDPRSSDRVFAVGRYGGVYRSDNAGAHWSGIATASALEGPLTVLALDDAVLVGTEFGIWRSVDQGRTWQNRWEGPMIFGGELDFHTLIRDPSDPRTIYGVASYQRLKSSDGGVTWFPIADPPFGVDGVFGFAVAPTRPTTIYEHVEFTSLVYRSRDAGTHWDGPFPAPTGDDIFRDLLLVDPRAADTVYAAGSDGLFVSRDSGESFQRVIRGLPELSPDRTAYSGVNALRTGSQGRILVATPKGLWGSADEGHHWQGAAGMGLHQNAVTNLRTDPLDPLRFLFLSFDDLYITGDGGGTFARVTSLARRQIDVIELDPLVRGRLLAIASGPHGPARQLLESRDSGATWTTVGLPPADGTVALALAPQALIAAAGDSLYRSQDDGIDWRLVAQIVPQEDNAYFLFSGLMADPLRPSVLYALGTKTIEHDGGSFPTIYRSQDSGLTWHVWGSGAVLALSPTRPGVAYVATLVTISRTVDDGQSFEAVGGDAPDVVTNLVIDRTRPEILYAGTLGSGVLASPDGGVSWAPLAGGLPESGMIGIGALAQDFACPRRLYAAVSSGGLWRVDADN